jgi:MYXO-CTERM domain-containing protein
MHPLRFLVFGALLAASLDVTSLVRADVPPTCSQFDSVVTCTADQVGMPCSAGGTCYQVYCADGLGGTNTQNLYKCEVCPTLLDAGVGPDGGGPCNYNSYGMPCADGRGVCEKAPEWCPSFPAVPYFSCLEPSDAGPPLVSSDGGGNPAQSDAGGSGTGPGTPTSSSSGCSASPDANRGWFAAGLGLVGVVALGLGRRRRPGA